jgi:hypothetical protein
MADQMRKRIAGVGAMRRPAKIHRLSATLIVLLTFALAATAAFALGLPQAFFSMLKGKTSDNDVNRYDKMDALTTPPVGTQDETGIGIRCYYDGKQIKLMIVHDAAFTLCDGIMLKSGEDLPRSKENNGKNEDGSVWESIEIETPLPKAAQDRDFLDIVLELKQSSVAEGQTRKIEVMIERSDAMTITHLAEAHFRSYAANLQVVMTPVNTLLYITLEAPTNWNFSQKTEESWFKEDFVQVTCCMLTECG